MMGFGPVRFFACSGAPRRVPKVPVSPVPDRREWRQSPHRTSIIYPIICLGKNTVSSNMSALRAKIDRGEFWHTFSVVMGHDVIVFRMEEIRESARVGGLRGFGSNAVRQWFHPERTRDQQGGIAAYPKSDGGARLVMAAIPTGQ